VLNQKILKLEYLGINMSLFLENNLFSPNTQHFGGTEYMAKVFHEEVADKLDFFDFSKYNCLIIPGEIKDLLEIIVEDKQIILWIHNTINQLQPVIQTLFKSKEFLSKIKYIIVVSEYHKNIIIKENNIDPSKIIIIHNVVKPVSYNIDKYKDIKNIKLIHTSHPERGFEVLVKSLKYTNENFTLNIYNDVNPDLNFVSDEYKKIYKDERIFFYGRTPKKTVLKELGESHIFAYPVIYQETFCLSQLEAMSANCLSLYHNYSSLKELSHGYGMPYELNFNFLNIEQHAEHFAKMIDLAIKKIKQTDFTLGDQSDVINKKYSIDSFIDSWIKLNDRIRNDN